VATDRAVRTPAIEIPHIFRQHRRRWRSLKMNR
jgi:hypothetical protein